MEFHLSNIYTKLGVKSRSEAILKVTDSQLRKSTGDGQVISTVDNSRDSIENGFKSILRRIAMKKPYYVIAGLSTAVLFLIMVIVKLPTKNNVEYVPMPFNQAIATDNGNTPLPAKTSQALTEILPAQLTTNQQSDIAMPPHIVNGYTASIETYYADTSRIIFLVRLAGGERVFGDKYFYGRFGDINLYDEFGNMLNASRGVAPAVDPALFQFEFVPVALLKGNHIKGQFAFDVNNAPEDKTILAKFRFDFDLPIHSDTRFYPKQSAITDNLEILLDSITVTPSFTQIYLCFPPITYAPWTIGHQSMLKIDGQEAYPIFLSELFNSETAENLSARSEPYWTSPIINGRCLKSLFPIGSSNPTSLTLTIPQLENLMPYANDEYLQISKLYPGLSP
ncbi:MAG TPA: hypothetical protein VFP87_01970, partial [Chitinophagaceae bacterium]|nr:hypothetical protein [Chitinophagaceae bacterium]